MKELVTLTALSAALAFAGDGSDQEREIRSAAQKAAYSTPVPQLFGSPTDDYTYRVIHEVANAYRGIPRPEHFLIEE